MSDIQESEMQEEVMDLVEPDIPVYLFTGFLEAGKTKFIQETLENYRFNKGERTLLLLCEEGELDYAPERFIGDYVFIKKIDREEQFTEEYMLELEEQFDIERVMIEYNGMWNIDAVFAALPPRWMVAQEFSFADFRSFLSYNMNMRQLVYDKLKSCELIVFNRSPKGADVMEHHKIVRAANRSCTLAYEHEDGSVDYDDIEDPLPFDIEAPVIEIADKDYAIWYRDMVEETIKYSGKTVSFKGQVSLNRGLPKNSFVIGRPMMTCCEADIAFAGLAVNEAPRMDFLPGDWVRLIAEIRLEKHPAYQEKGPVLYAIELNKTEPPEEELATFY